jgi:rhodanese-related sulfurtransferase
MKSIHCHRLGFVAAAVLLLVCTLAVPQGYADKVFPTVDTDQLKAMIDQKQVFTLIDARTPPEYKEAHLIKAINIPDTKWQENLGLLPADKGALLVIYCNGVKCGKSGRLAKQLDPLGYTNIKVYAEGIPVWEERNLPLFVGPDYDKKIETKKFKPADIDRMIREKKGIFRRRLISPRKPLPPAPGYCRKRKRSSSTATPEAAAIWPTRN